MSKSRLADFKPIWAESDPKILAALEDTPALGFTPEPPPRLPTRILPTDGGNRLSAQTVYHILYTTQRILNYNAYEVVNGPDPDTTPDLRSLDERLEQLAELHVVPFDGGSFVIPGELGEETHRFYIEKKEVSFTSRDVLKRFADVMNGVAVSGADFPTCLGVLETIERLGKIINREASGIEYKPSGFTGQDAKPRTVVVNAEYVNTVAKAALHRKSRKSFPGTLQGVLTLVDVLEHKLKVRVFQPEGKVIPGTFLALATNRVAALLGKEVTLYGTVTAQQGEPIRIDVSSVDPLPER